MGRPTLRTSPKRLKKAPKARASSRRGAAVSKIDADKRILLLAPGVRDAKEMGDLLKTAGFSAERCRDMAGLCGKLKDGGGVIVLADAAKEKDALSGLLRALRDEPSWSDIPIIMVVGRDDTAQRALRRLTARGPASEVTFLERPFHPDSLVNAVRVAMKSRLRQYQVRDLLASQRQGEQRLQGILNSISEAFVAVDREWRFTYINRAYMDLVKSLYRSPSELLGHSLWEKFPDIVNAPSGKFYRRAMATQKTATLELFYAPISRWLEIHAHPSPEILSIYVTDITQRKQQEEQLHELSLQIANQARIFDTALSHIADFAYTFDLEGRFTYVNKPLLDLWGLKLEQAVGKNFHDLNYPKDLAQKLQRQIRQVIRTGKQVKDETAYTNPEGLTGYYEYIFTPVFGEDGVEVVAGSTRLITERKRNEAVLREAKETAEAANRAKDRFLAVLSHELRTPLTPVLMTVASMEADPLLSPETRENLSMIRRNVELETKLIDDLLDLSRVAAGKLALNSELIEVNSVVRHAHSICGPYIAEKDLEFNCDYDPSAGLIHADPSRFRQVLWNLFNNAVKFTPKGGRIYVLTRRLGDDRVQIEVRDNGVGIPEELLPRIFDAFEQGGNMMTRQFGGLGLGLAICKALVEMHGGIIRAESRGRDEGASFFIEMPRVEPAPGAMQAVPAVPEAFVDGRALRLLVVEDHRDTANAIARLLRRSGYTVETAADVASALTRTKEIQFDLVLSDLGLPDGDGYELMRWLRERGDIKGIAMSGYGMDEDVRKSREAGYSEHLVKPVNATHLREAIRRVTGELGNGNGH